MVSSQNEQVNVTKWYKFGEELFQSKDIVCCFSMARF